MANKRKGIGAFVDEQATFADEPQRIRSWSFSTHKKIERCPASAKYAKIDHLPDPSGFAAERGNRLHGSLEQFILGEAAYPNELLAWRPALDERMAGCTVGEDLIPELEIALDHQWKRTSWDEAVVRAKLDLVCVEDDDWVEVVDFKTGRRYEQDHRDQLELYAVLALHVYPWCAGVRGAAWYLDRPGDVLALAGIPRELYEKTLLAKWKKVVALDTSRTVWPAVRNVYCKSCAFHARKGGPCTEGA